MDRYIGSIRSCADDLDPLKFAISCSEPAYNIQGAYVLDMLIARNFSKKFIYYDISGSGIEAADALALLWRDTLKALDVQIAALATAALADFDPYEDYSRTRTYYETAGNTKETTYGKTDTKLGNSSNSVTYGSNTTNDVVTFDATLRDQTKSTHGGTDSNAGTSASTSTLSGTDTQTDDGDRSIAESVSGYNHNKSESLAKYLDVKLRDDLIDFVLNDFERRYLYYGGE